MENKTARYFIVFGLLSLILGAFIGVLLSFVYISPTFLKAILPFNILRPLHTTTVISWIILTTTGGIYYYLRHIEKIKMKSALIKWHLIIFLITGFAIYFSVLTGNLGGREYLEFFPLLIIFILIGWVLFGINYFISMVNVVKNWPVYFWMWGVGMLFMIYHLTEAHFWIFGEIRKDFIKDISIQWKSYGSFVGSWNMLVYGTAIYLMSKIKNDDQVGRGKMAFFFFFLGLTNLMFGWAHHTYLIPSQPWIRVVAYAVSMTEWIIFFNILYQWAKTLKKAQVKKHAMAFRFLMASELWVFINIVLALIMSIPAFNIYTHGTHITVAHSMGTTIGINTMILLASVYFISGHLKKQERHQKWQIRAFYVLNISLLVFFISLIFVGIIAAIHKNSSIPISTSEIYENAKYYVIVFIAAGISIFTSLIFLVSPLIKTFIKGEEYHIRN